MKNVLIVLLIIIIVVLGAYFVYNEFLGFQESVPILNTKTNAPIVNEQSAQTQTTTLLLDVEKQTGVDFTDIEQTQIEWLVENLDRVNVSGEKITGRILYNNSNIIDDYFRNNGFEVNMNNLADGPSASRIAFTKDQMVCTILVRGEHEEFTMPDDSTMASVEVECGILDQ